MKGVFCVPNICVLKGVRKSLLPGALPDSLTMRCISIERSFRKSTVFSSAHLHLTLPDFSACERFIRSAGTDSIIYDMVVLGVSLIGSPHYCMGVREIDPLNGCLLILICGAGTEATEM